MNFAEQLTYWYLRLNGFFPLTNFLPHRDSAEIDAVALRFPHVSEEIGGNPVDWDPRFRRDWEICLETEQIGLFVEIKSGERQGGEAARAGEDWRLLAGIKRMGVLRPDVTESVARELKMQPRVRSNGYTVAKLFVDRYADGPPNWLHLRLQDADQFIRDRMARYHPEKYADRTRFDGDLIQYLAWAGGR